MGFFFSGISRVDGAEGAPKNWRSFGRGEGEGGPGHLRHDPVQPAHARRAFEPSR